MKYGQPNALTFFIMAQALKNVKPVTPLRSEAFREIKKVEDTDLDEEDLVETEIFDIDDKVLSIDWEYLDNIARSSWFGQMRNDCEIVEDHVFLLSPENYPLVIVRIDSLSEDILSAIALGKSKGSQIWLSPRSPDFWGSLGEKDMCLSNQIGFGFVVLSNFRDHFEASKHFWRHFFVSHQSRQWIWPWCDMILAHLANSLKQGSVKKNWTDPLSPKSLSKTEEDVIRLFETVLGGQGMTSVVLSATSKHLLKKGFFDSGK